MMSDIPSSPNCAFAQVFTCQETNNFGNIMIVDMGGDPNNPLELRNLTVGNLFQESCDQAMSQILKEVVDRYKVQDLGAGYQYAVIDNLSCAQAADPIACLNLSSCGQSFLSLWNSLCNPCQLATTVPEPGGNL
jgi:hypothetical protein